MDLNLIRAKMHESLHWKNIAHLRELINALPDINDVKLDFGDRITISSPHANKEYFHSIAKALMPWRKGPFEIFDVFIDSEWQSFIKYNLLKKHFDLKDNIVGDIGCNNGYYLFRMSEERPKKLIGFDPSPLCKTQFDFINFYAKKDIKFELLGIEHLSFYEHKFDTLFCLGVLYHRHNPIECLKWLFKALNPKGELFLDTFFILHDEEMVLSPQKTYSKIPNVHFIPSQKALENWLKKAGFEDIQILAKKKTDLNEQRKTQWIQGESLNNFLDPEDENKTIEGYPAPQRIYIKAIKG